MPGKMLLHRFVLSVALSLSGALPVLLSSVAQAQENPPVYSLPELLVKAREGSPVMAIARAQLTDYLAQFDRAYYAWTPRLRVDTLLAPLPERRELRRCVSLAAPTDPTNNLAEVFPCPGQNLQADARITAETEIFTVLDELVDSEISFINNLPTNDNRFNLR